MKRMLLLALAVTVIAPAQEAKLVPVKYRLPADICQLLLKMGLAYNAVHCGRNSLGVIGLKGTPEEVGMLEGMIRKLDQPPPARRNIEISAYMILGTAEKSTDLPQSLMGVVAQLKQLFPYNGYTLIETMLIRGVEDDGGEASGMMPVPGDTELKPIYQFRYRQCSIAGDGAERRFHLQDIRFGGKIPIPAEKGFSYIDTGVNTTVDIREGQKAVIGKASLGPGKESLFLVLSARLVE